MQRYVSSNLVLLFAFVLASAGTLAKSDATASKDLAAPSQIEFNASGSITAMRNKLRKSAAEAFRKSPPVPVSAEQDGVRVTVTPTILAHDLELKGRSSGQLDVSVPIRISVAVKKSFWTSTVGVKGCEEKTFKVKARFDPEITSSDGLRFAIGDVSVEPTDYQCGLHWVVELKDVAAIILDQLKALGGAAFKARLREFNALLPKEAELLDMLKKPAEFGGSVTLGIDTPHLQIKHFASKGDVYQISGVVEGRPRLLFGDGWTGRERRPGDAVAKAGFRLPARLLFPTDATLLPDASVQEASGCLGSFRLHPVPKRRDLAVLQRCGPNFGSNVIWLSGANEAPSQDVRMFNRSMSNVLTEIVAWLDDASLWRDVEGVSDLRQEVSAFRKLLELFQEEARIPVDTRGSVHFFDLNLDLIGVWVNNEAILADVMLTGKARLDIKLTL